MSTKKRIILVDDHPIFRKGVSAPINADGTFEVCGEASNAREALSLMRTLSPEAALIDIGLPGANGIELIKMLKAESPGILILVLSMHNESTYAIRALKAGARAYLIKGESGEVVLRALTEVFAGNLFVSKVMYERLIFRAIQTLDVGAETPFERLTSRELQVFDMMGSGFDKNQIARELGLSLKTVDTYRQNARQKLCCRDMVELERFASDWRLYQTSEPADTNNGEFMTCRQA